MEGSIKKRLLAMLVVVVMLLSTVMIFSTTMAETYLEVETQGKIPGVTVWAACSATTVGASASANGSVLNTSTANLYYDQTVSINVNGSLSWGAGPYWVWYPKYTGALGDTYNLTWAKWKPSTGPHPTIGGTDLTFENVHLNRSGLWIIDDDAVHDGSSFANMNSTIPAWFWVNSSSDLVITLSETSVDYGEKKNVVVNVKKGGEAVPCTVDVRAFSDNATVFSAGNAWVTSGEFSFRADTTNFSHAGVYNVYAYVDKDSQDIYYKEMPTPPYYSTAYGDGSVDATIENDAGWYEYDCCGPWDPPEYNQSAIKTITVGVSKPVITATNTSNVYWGYDAKLEVNVTDQYGKGLTGGASKLKIKNRDGAYLTNATDPTNLTITETGAGNGNYTVQFARGSANWTSLYTSYCNGTWKIVYADDVAGSSDEEWNNSLSFTVKSKAPAVRMDVINDGGGDSTDMKVDVPAYTYGNENNTINILFIIYGGAVDGPKAYYGDTAGENEYNITVSGDILYPAVLTYNASGNYGWDAKVTPTIPGGSITVAIDWEGNGTDSATINIINGTTITPSVDSFTVDENISLTVTVKSQTGSLLEYANVTLFWGDWDSAVMSGSEACGDVINSTNGDGTAGNGANGEYTFSINTTNQRDIAPQNITIAARTHPSSVRWGYTQVLMDRNHDLVVNCTPTVSYAGISTEYDIYVTLVSGGKPEEDNTLYVKIYNETGGLVTGIDEWYSQGSADIEDETIPLSGGTYYLYAYNNTHDSEGHNATIIVTPYSVESSPSVLAWLVDTATNMTFQVTPAGNGTLTLKNMSGAPNASDFSAEYDIEITNGVGTLDEVNATTLGNVTFAYTPNDGVLRPAEGLLRITTATAVPNPATVYIAEPTILEIALTHPATGLPLQGVRVGLDHGKNLSTTLLIKLPADQFSDANGKVYFSIETGGSGNITIYMENQTDPDNPFVIKSAARKTMQIYTDPTVNEGDTFIVTAKSGGVVITDSTVTMEFAGITLTTTDGTVEFTAPSVQDSVNYMVQATADGYTSDDATIKVLNVRKLVIVITSTEVSGGSAFDVTIADDAGSSVIGVTITIDQKTYTTGAQGTATITAPEKQGDYIITATFPGYTDADPYTITIKAGQIPGFELLTLIAAIGVAFILLRRRRN